MQLNDLLYTLSAFRPEPIQIPEPEAEIFAAQLLLEGEEPTELDVLYVCTARRFHALSLFSPKGVLCGSFLVCGTPAPERVASAQLNLISIANMSDRLAVFNRASEPFLQEQRLAVGMRVLAAGLYHNKGLQHLIDVAYTVLKNPIFVSDTTNKYLAAVYDESFVEPGSQFENFIFSDILYNYIDEGGRAFIKELNLDEILAQSSQPYCTYHSHFGAEAMFSAVRVHNVIAGKIFMVAVEHPFQPMDYRYFEQLVGLVNQELLTMEAVVRNRYESGALFLIDLLTTSHADPEMLQRAVGAFKFVPKGDFFMGAFQSRDNALNSDALHQLCSQLKNLLPTHPAAVLDGRLVVLFNMAASRTLRKYLWEELDGFCRRNNLIMGVSNRFGDLGQIRRYYDQVIETVQLGRRNFPDRPIVHFRDVSLPALLSSYAQKNSLAELISPEIRAIRDYDRKNGTEYLRTLSLYLAHAGNSQAVSEILHIHKNTLLYRTNKLTEHFGLELNNGDRTLEYQLSIRILSSLADMQPGEGPGDGSG